MVMEAAVMAGVMAEYKPVVEEMVTQPVAQPRQSTERTRLATSYDWMVRSGSV